MIYQLLDVLKYIGLVIVFVIMMVIIGLGLLLFIDSRLEKRKEKKHGKRNA